VSRLNALALLEPLFPGNQAIERSWSPLWSVYLHRWDEQGNQVISILWNLFWQERQGDRLAWELFPLADYRREDSGARLQLLKGLLALRRDQQHNCLSLFYLPWETCWEKQSTSSLSPAAPGAAGR